MKFNYDHCCFSIREMIVRTIIIIINVGNAWAWLGCGFFSWKLFQKSWHHLFSMSTPSTASSLLKAWIQLTVYRALSYIHLHTSYRQCVSGKVKGHYYAASSNLLPMHFLYSGSSFERPLSWKTTSYGRPQLACMNHLQLRTRALVLATVSPDSHV